MQDIKGIEEKRRNWKTVSERKCPEENFRCVLSDEIFFPDWGIEEERRN